MAQPDPAPPVKLFVITLHKDLQILENARSLLIEKFGAVDFESADFPFGETNYYESEMGSDLQRRFVSFEKLIDPSLLPDIKLFTNEIEDRFKEDSQRRINLDPGYVDLYKLVLASAKYGGQKIYLRDGIYADMTMVMYKKQWETFAWGFPDLKSHKYDSVLNAIREIYKKQKKL